MSLTHTDDGIRGTRRCARDRKRRGWITIWRNEDGHRWDRRDYCPKCAGSHRQESSHDRA